MPDFQFSRQDVERIISLVYAGQPGSHVLNGFLAGCIAEAGADAAVAARLVEGDALLHLYDPYDEYSGGEALINGLRAPLSTLLAADPEPVGQLPQGAPALQPLATVLAASAVSHFLLLFPPTSAKERSAVILLRKERAFTTAEADAAEQPAALAGLCLMAMHAIDEQQRLYTLLTQKAKLETLGKLAAGIAHDVSNILAGIFGSTALLKKKIAGMPDATHLIEIIESSSMRARDITRGLLSYGKTTPRQKDVVQPVAILHELEGVLRGTLPPAIRFECHTGKNVRPVMGNGTQLYQVLMNLCVNARDAISGSGSLIIGVKNVTVSAGASDVPAHLAPGEYIHFFVQDSGRGIAPHLLNRIFDPYFSTRETEGGTGLGLYIVYGIIQAHNGSITVQSEEGVGTGFDIYIPACEPEHHEALYVDPVVIIADDEAMLRDLLAELLESAGYYVISVDSGEAALHVLTEELNADVLVVDYQMPGMNGLETVRRVRQLGVQVPVILSTGSAGAAQSAEIEALGVRTVLVKPYDFEEMLTAIKQIV